MSIEALHRAENLAVSRPDVLEESLRGAFGCTTSSGTLRIRRLPEWTASQYGGDLLLEVAARHTSGVRLEFMSSARHLELDCILTRTADFGETPRVPVLAATVDDRELVVPVGLPTDLMILHRNARRVEFFYAEPVTVVFDFGRSVSAPRPVTVWLPPTSGTEVLEVRSDAPLVPATEHFPRWIHHGSSISQCMEADGPLGVWPVIVARKLGLDLTSLGLVGGAMLDQFTARTIRDLPADVITIKIGINIVDQATHTRRSFIPAVHGFLDTIREGHRHTEMTIISPIYCPTHERTLDPTRWFEGRAAKSESAFNRDDRPTLSAIRSMLADVVDARSANDPHLNYLNGLDLLGPNDARMLPDGVHPDQEGYRLIAARFVSATSRLPIFSSPFVSADLLAGQSN